MNVTPDRPQVSNDQTDPDTAVERAKVLLAILKEKRDQKGIAPLIAEAESAVNTHPERAIHPELNVLRQSARELLARIGKRIIPKPAGLSGPMGRDVLRSTIAALVDGQHLSREHPAIIAIVIEHQSTQTQAAVLRSLPGRLARRVQRDLRIMMH